MEHPAASWLDDLHARFRERELAWERAAEATGDWGDEPFFEDFRLEHGRGERLEAVRRRAPAGSDLARNLARDLDWLRLDTWGLSALTAEIAGGRVTWLFGGNDGDDRGAEAYDADGAHLGTRLWAGDYERGAWHPPPTTYFSACVLPTLPPGADRDDAALAVTCATPLGPLADLPVTIRHDLSLTRTGRTDGEGRVEFADLPGGFASVETSLGRARVQLRGGERVEVAPIDAGRLVRAVDAGGAPLAGVQVRAGGRRRPPSDARGWLLLPRGEGPFELALEHPGHRPLRREVAPTEDGPQTLVLAPAPRLRLRALDAAGAPLRELWLNGVRHAPGRDGALALSLAELPRLGPGGARRPAPDDPPGSWLVVSTVAPNRALRLAGRPRPDPELTRAWKGAARPLDAAQAAAGAHLVAWLDGEGGADLGELRLPSTRAVRVRVARGGRPVPWALLAPRWFVGPAPWLEPEAQARLRALEALGPAGALAGALADPDFAPLARAELRAEQPLAKQPRAWGLLRLRLRGGGLALPTPPLALADADGRADLPWPEPANWLVVHDPSAPDDPRPFAAPSGAAEVAIDLDAP